MSVPFGAIDDATRQRVESFRRWAFIVLVVPHLIPALARLDDPMPWRRASHLVLAAVVATAAYAILRAGFRAFDAATHPVATDEQRRRRFAFEVLVPLACVAALWGGATWAVAVAMTAS